MKRAFLKQVIRTAIVFGSDFAISKALTTYVPPARKYKIAQITGSLASWYLGEKLGAYTDQLVDKFADKHVSPVAA